MLRYDKSEREKKENPLFITTISLITIIFFTLIIFKIDLTKLIFKELNSDIASQDKNITNQAENTQRPEQIYAIEEMIKKAEIKTMQENMKNIHQETKPEQIISKVETKVIKAKNEERYYIYPEGTIFSYTDNNGEIFMVESIQKIPKEYRENMKASKPSIGRQGDTKIEVQNNQIHVPVKLTCQGKTATFRMQVDTGANVTTISPAIAQRLEIKPTGRSEAIIANGQRVATYTIYCEKITVGTNSKTNIKVSIMPRSSNEEAGLLGMDFLSDFPHTISTQTKMIKWQ